jgi:predicted PurR-regulated permease PerM
LNRQQSPTSGGAPLAIKHPAATHDEGPLHLAVSWATIGIFLILFGAVLYLTRAVLVPVVAAAIVSTTLGPLSRRAGQHRIPPWLFAFLVVVALVAILHISTLIFFVPISKWIDRAPELGAIIKDKLHAMDSALATIRGLQSAVSTDGSSGFKIDFSTFIEPVLGFLTPAVSQLIIFLATLLFFLVGHAALRRSLILVFSSQDARLSAIRVLNEIEEDLARYAATVTVINFALGCLTAMGAYVIGLPNPVLWGFLAFLCNFVPYIGPAFVLCVLFGIGLINFPSVGYALIAPAFYVTLTTLEGHFITPNIVGQRFTLSPLAVFLALVFWTWLWGPVGGFLAVPILIVGLTVFNHMFVEDETALPG